MRAIISVENDKQQVIDLKGNGAAHTAGTRMNARGGYRRRMRGNQRNPGPRFTVSIKTLVDTAKGEAREGFDIVVHDAESGAAKSVAAMSGGERVWINECLTRAIALYLAQNAGKRYETLFSDEVDGPLDVERKRMFMAMTREVLRIGRYDREYFVSQTPELTAMADAVIDLEELGREGDCASPRYAEAVSR